MSLILSLFCIYLAAAAEVSNQPPTVIEADEPEEIYPRSVNWPIKNDKLPSRSPLPQFDDALNSSGDVQVRQQGSPTFSIRGSGQSGRVLTLFDNVPLNFATGFGPPFILLPKEIIGDMSISKGPSSLFYGSEAMAGSVHFIPQKNRRSELRMMISDTDNSYLPWGKATLSHYNFTLLAPLVFSKKSFHQVSLFNESDDGLFPYQDNSGQSVRNNNSSQTNRATMIGQQSWGRFNFNYDVIAGKEKRISPGPTNSPLRTTQNSEGYLVSLAPSYKPSEESMWRTRVSYLNTQANYQETGNDTYFDQQTLIFQNEYEIEVSRYSFKVFADYFSHAMDNTYFGNNLKQDSFELAPYASVYLTPIFYLQAGTRYLFRNEKLLSSIGIYHTPYPFKVWLLMSEGFRQATLSDKFATTPFSVANPNLQPEQSRQYELGFQYQPVKTNTTTYKPYFTSELRLYRINYANFFDTQLVSATQSQKINRGSGESYGADSNFDFNWGPWVWGLKYNYLKTKNDQLNQPFRLSPEHQLSWSVDHYIGPFFLRLQNVVWQKTFDRDLSGNLVLLPDWNQWNLEFHSYGFKHLNFAIGVLNLFDAAKQLTLYYPEPQRRYWAQVRYQF